MSKDIILTDYLQKANYYRGLVINDFILLEIIIEQIITDEFFGVNSTNIKANQFKNIILNRMNFDAKRTALKYIFDRMQEDNGFIKTKNNSYPNSKVINEVRLLIDERNRFAHYLSMQPVKEGNTVLVLAEFRDKGKFHYYSEEDINALRKRISNMRTKLFDLFESTGAVPDSSNPAELPNP